jgi:hypothetical protein
MLTIQNNQIIDAAGNILKTLSCPRRISDADLESPHAPDSRCVRCSRAIMNTDYQTETQIIARLKEDPTTCLKISLYNPIFRFSVQEP